MKIRNLKIYNKKRFLALLLSGSIGITALACSISKKGEGNIGKALADNSIVITMQTLEPTNEPVLEAQNELLLENEDITNVDNTVSAEVGPTIDYNFSRNDTVITTSDVNMRIGTSTKDYKYLTLDKGTVLNRILTTNDWDLVQYGEQIGFVSGQYTIKYSENYNNQSFYYEDCKDIVRATTGLNFRLGPTQNDQKLFTMEKNEEAIVIAKAISYNDSNDVWYVVKCRGKIGYINAGYTASLKDNLAKTNPEITDITVKKMAYFPNDSALKTAPSNSASDVAYIERYQSGQILAEGSNWYFIKVGTKCGYVSKNSVHIMGNVFVIVDISEQRIYLYRNNEIIAYDKVSTGKKNTPTNLGYQEIIHHLRDYYMQKWDLHVDYYICFNRDAQALHDYDQPYSDFGTQRSHGCVRTPDKTISLIYDEVNNGDYVLVQK